MLNSDRHGTNFPGYSHLQRRIAPIEHDCKVSQQWLYTKASAHNKLGNSILILFFLPLQIRHGRYSYSWYQSGGMSNTCITIQVRCDNM
jgi:hypothetical protein